MKKTLLLLSIVFLSATFISAKAEGNKFGIRAGYQSTYLFLEGSKLGDGASGYYAGIFKDREIAPLFRLSAGLELSQFGGEVVKEDVKLTYIGVPVLIKAKLGPVSALAGSGVNFKVSDSNIDDARTVDIPISVGAGFNILFINIEARYVWGMNDIIKDSGLRNQAFQIGLSARF